MILVRFTIDNRNRLIFYGNTVGYVKDDAAVVDEMFQTDELSRYLARLNLTPQWKEYLTVLQPERRPARSWGSRKKAAASGSSGKAWMSPCALSDMRI